MFAAVRAAVDRPHWKRMLKMRYTLVPCVQNPQSNGFAGLSDIPYAGDHPGASLSFRHLSTAQRQPSTLLPTKKRLLCCSPYGDNCGATLQGVNSNAPFSDSIFPPMSLKQIAHLKGYLRSGRKPCFWCGKPIRRLTDTATIDHVVPLSRGGRSSLDNLVPCCGPCNLMKADSELSEWLERVEQIVNRLRGLVTTG